MATESGSFSIALLFIALMLSSLACKKSATPQPSASTFKSEPELTGTWRFERDSTDGMIFCSTVTVASNGNYVCDLTNLGIEHLKWEHIEGKWEIKNGVLIDTMMKHSNTNAHLPFVSRAKIIHFGTNELALRYENTPGNYLETVFIKYNGN